jgi:16S rRNA (guanine966-N2)-methyltransferase
MTGGVIGMAAGAVRVVGGEFGGRRLAIPKDSRVRPTADRVREAWMSILGE